MNDGRGALVRESEGICRRSRADALVGQTAHSAAQGNRAGNNPGNGTTGRKRFLLVDTLGLILGSLLFFVAGLLSQRARGSGQ